jgi:hypothetical protein
VGAWFGGAYFQARKARSEQPAADVTTRTVYEPRGNDCVANHQCRFDEVCLRMPLPFYAYLDDIRAGGDGFHEAGRCSLPRPGDSFGKIHKMVDRPSDGGTAPAWDFNPKPDASTPGPEDHPG